MGFANGLLHVRLRVPSFMATLGVWFIGVGIANAMLGGMAIRINDPLIRDSPSSARSAFRGEFWLALLCLAIAYVIQNHTRLGRYVYALGGGEELAALSGIPVARGSNCHLHHRRRVLRHRGVLAAAQLGLGNSQIRRRPPFRRRLQPSSSEELRSQAAKAACCKPSSAC